MSNGGQLAHIPARLAGVLLVAARCEHYRMRARCQSNVVAGEQDNESDYDVIGSLRSCFGCIIGALEGRS